MSCTGGDSTVDRGVRDGAAPDATADTGREASARNDSSSPATTTPRDAGDPSNSANAPVDVDPSDASCPRAWLVAPRTSASLVPDSGLLGHVVVHVGAKGIETYACSTNADDASSTWTLKTPYAMLIGCDGTVIGRQFSSAAGIDFPEWELSDGQYVVGHMVGSFTPDGGAGSTPWLLVQVDAPSEGGVLSITDYVQRLNTDGGLAPAQSCGDAGAGALVAVPYSADYYFYGP